MVIFYVGLKHKGKGDTMFSKKKKICTKEKGNQRLGKHTDEFT